jgi:hypothetical protein
MSRRKAGKHENHIERKGGEKSRKENGERQQGRRGRVGKVK